LAGRLARHLGAPRLSWRHQWRAWREDPHRQDVRYYFVYATLERRGPYPAWRALVELDELDPATPPDARGEWYSLKAQVAAQLRDFDAADEWIARAIEIAPAHAWIHVARSSVLESQDLYPEAYEAARQALELQPWFRPAVQAASHLLSLLGRDEEGLALLHQGARRLESAAVWMQLYGLEIELEDFAAAAEALDRVAELSPLMEKEGRSWLMAQRAYVAYRRAKLDETIELGHECGDSYSRDIARRLCDASRADGRRLVLPVGFVRQHHVTCGPATLAAISRYWNMPAEHLQVAEEICYNGTPAYAERQWAEGNGWMASEFTVNEASAKELLDRGIPFTLTTVEPTNSHLQAVIGYDGRRGTLVIRDPYLRDASEALADNLLEHYRPFGPRGMALVPATQRERLTSLELPDAQLWDELHALDRSLIAHRRDDALAICNRLDAVSPDHRIAIEARRRLAIYDANPAEALKAAERLLVHFPENPTLELLRLSCSRMFLRRDERLQTYERICSKPYVHPIFVQQYAQELQYDARQHDLAARLLRRALRAAPQTASGYHALANLYWSQRRFDDALALYRVAACLEDKDEEYAHAYFSASQCLKRTDQALELLRRRFKRFGAKSSQPARTLERACRHLDRIAECQEVLEEALRLRPDDGELLLYAADAQLAYSASHTERADELLRAASDKCARSQWLRCAARLAWSRGALTDALDRWREVVELQPLAVDAHGSVARLLAETQGRSQALSYLAERVEQFPHFHPLLELWIEWLRDEPPAVAEPVIRRAVEQNPADAWARRELGLALARDRRLDEAWAEVEAACALEPSSDASHAVRGVVCYHRGLLSDAQAAYRDAIRLNVDNDFAINGLMGCCDTPAQRREALNFVRGELERQVMFGDGLLGYREHAQATLAADEVLSSLREALAARPDLWHAWSACVAQLVSMNRLEEAWPLIQQATQRFPLLPKLWMDRAQVCRARLDEEGELNALETALGINPAWGAVARGLAEVYVRRGDLAQARSALERGAAHDPLDPFTQGGLADLAERAGEREQAVAFVRRAVELFPGYEWAWERLKEWSPVGAATLMAPTWSTAPNRPQHAVEVAQSMCSQRPGESRCWLMLARMLPDSEFDARMEAVDRAISLNPRLIDGYDLKALLLAQRRRLDEALAACQPTAWGDHPPVELRARRAWIESLCGNLNTAILLMQDCVVEEANHYGCWMRMAELRRQRGEWPEYLAAAQALERIDPQNEMSLGYLGEALLAAGRREEAKQYLTRAFRLATTYEFAGLNLFDLQLEDGEIEEASQTLKAVAQHTQNARVLAREIQLAARQGDRERALERFRRLCVTPGDEPGVLEAALAYMDERGWQPYADSGLKDAVFDSQSAREVGSVWVRRRISARDWSWRGDLQKLCSSGPAGEQALNEYLTSLVNAKSRWTLAWFVRRNRDWLRSNTFAWGSVGYAYVALNKSQSAVKWLSDWRERPEAEPWMLMNLVATLRHRKRDQEAAEVSRRAIAMPRDYFTAVHHLWLASDALVAGAWEDASAHLQASDRNSLSDNDRAFDSVLDLTLRVLSPSTIERKTFRNVRRQMNSLAKQMQNRSRERVFHRCVRAIARRFGWRGQLWLVERFVFG
jgi:tetratricopeptide (TPR) repeat protein